jgi:23S rRNA maturation-related 3'-5' exoribonuclease YhaM
MPWIRVKTSHHHHKHQGLDPLIPSVCRVTAALANVSWVFQLILFIVACICMILEGFGCVAFFVCVKASSFCIRLSYLVCLLSVILGV